MSIEQIIKDSLIRIRVESDQAEKEFEKFTKASDQASESLGDTAKKADEAKKAVDGAGKAAEASTSRFAKFTQALSGAGNSLAGAFSSLSTKVSGGIEGIDKFAKKLGPWNQALELGGKVLKVAGEGMDAYAKTSAEAAESVKRITDEFNGYKTAVLEMVGAVTVAVAGTIQSIDDLERRIAMGKFTKPAAALRWQSLLGGDDEAGSSTLDKDKFRVSLTIFNRVLGEQTALYEKNAAAAKKAAEEGARWKAEYAEQMSALRRQELRNKVTGGPGPQQDAVTEFLASGRIRADNASQLGMLDAGLASMQEQSSRESRYAAFQQGKRNSFLEALGLDKPSEINAALTAVQGLTAGMQSAFQIIGEGSLSAGEALKKGLGIAVKALGDKLAAFAAAEAVEGAAMLVTLNPAGALHLAAAGLYGAGAVAAYAAASKLGGGGGSVPSVPGANAGAAASAASAGTSATYYLGYDGRPMNGGGTTVNQYIGYADEDSPRMRQRRDERIVARGTQRTSIGGAF